MSIHNLLTRIKAKIATNNKPLSNVEIVDFDSKRGEMAVDLRKFYLGILIVLSCTASFGLGKLSVNPKVSPPKIDYISLEGMNKAQAINSFETKSPTGESQNSGGVVASKSGTKYHYSYCAGAKQIKESNKITFDTATQAEKAGYQLALNCKPR